MDTTSRQRLRPHRFAPQPRPIAAACASILTLAAPALAAPLPPTPFNGAALVPDFAGAASALGAGPVVRAATTAAAAVDSTASLVVTSCGDDPADSTTLRHAVAGAGPGAMIDLGALACSKITLTNGAIPIAVDDLTIVGAGTTALTVDGNGADRVFLHTGKGTLTLLQMTIERGSIAADRAYGGCIASNGSVALQNVVVFACQAFGQTKAAGGGVFAARTVSLDTSVLANNGADATIGPGIEIIAASGGGAAAQYKIELTDSRVTNNVVRAASGIPAGGGLDTLHMRAKYSTIANNEAIGVGDAANHSAGGGFRALYSLELANSTVDHNSADFGGGVIIAGSGFKAISQSTISGNSAARAYGAMLAYSNLSLSNSTIAFNQAGQSDGGVKIGNGSSLEIDGTIIANNAQSDLDIGTGVAITGVKNLIMLSNLPAELPLDTIGIDPLLAPLAYNGGRTRTHALSPDSPARNAAGNPVSPLTDQRGIGFARIVGGAADIGAFELDPDRIFTDTFGGP